MLHVTNVARNAALGITAVNSTLKPLVMRPVFGSHQGAAATSPAAHATDETGAANELGHHVGADRPDGAGPSPPHTVDPSEEPLAGLRNVYSEGGRVSWFDYTVHPSKRFLYWCHRSLRQLPADWQPYYRRQLAQEMRAAHLANGTWDVFMGVVDGYRKGKWVLRKFEVQIDESRIPHPYNNFWEVTTPEERAWAHRRATRLKDLQGLQRALDDDAGLDDGGPAFGGQRVDFNDAHISLRCDGTSRDHSGSAVHSADLAAPSERDVRDEGTDTYSQALIGSIEDDKHWNPVLRNRIHHQKTRAEAAMYDFEDD